MDEPTEASKLDTPATMRPDVPDYYRDLGVSPTDSSVTIYHAVENIGRSAYPGEDDIGILSSFSIARRKASRAREFLLDPAKRAEYDKIHPEVKKAWDEFYRQHDAETIRAMDRSAEAIAIVERQEIERDKAALRKLQETLKQIGPFSTWASEPAQEPSPRVREILEKKQQERERRGEAAEEKPMVQETTMA
ncbi:hypothetical protein ONZ43_g5771 [Nemania bipapillata]|uniref:Uncharacterized protein n=1 Tax=Nemania bipapillata TaxID=110536 RepID=A0ACC2I6W1_9PEZI|nr:hypothetical protein ONZ43_g5771 [Nemania bipapillata]